MTKIKPPKNYRIATMEDYHNGSIKIDTLYWLQSYKEPCKIRRKMQVETDKEYNDNYRKVILTYIKESRLYIQL